MRTRKLSKSAISRPNKNSQWKKWISINYPKQTEVIFPRRHLFTANSRIQISSSSTLLFKKNKWFIFSLNTHKMAVFSTISILSMVCPKNWLFALLTKLPWRLSTCIAKISSIEISNQRIFYSTITSISNFVISGGLASWRKGRKESRFAGRMSTWVPKSFSNKNMTRKSIFGRWGFCCTKCFTENPLSKPPLFHRSKISKWIKVSESIKI